MHPSWHIPILVSPADAGLFVVDTDASQPLGIGVVLSRLQRNDTERVIAYGSRSLNEQEKNYCGTGYVDHFRYYVMGQKIAPED